MHFSLSVRAVVLLLVLGLAWSTPALGVTPDVAFVVEGTELQVDVSWSGQPSDLVVTGLSIEPGPLGLTPGGQETFQADGRTHLVHRYRIGTRTSWEGQVTGTLSWVSPSGPEERELSSESLKVGPPQWMSARTLGVSFVGLSFVLLGVTAALWLYRRRQAERATRAQLRALLNRAEAAAATQDWRRFFGLVSALRGALLSLGVPTDTLPSADELMAELERAHFGGVPLSPERAEQLLAACAGALETA